VARQQPDREHLIYGRGGGDATPTEWAAIVIDTDTSADSFTIMNVTVDDSLGHNYVMYAMYAIRPCLSPSTFKIAHSEPQDPNHLFLPPVQRTWWPITIFSTLQTQVT